MGLQKVRGMIMLNPTHSLFMQSDPGLVFPHKRPSTNPTTPTSPHYHTPPPDFRRRQPSPRRPHTLDLRPSRPIPCRHTNGLQIPHRNLRRSLLIKSFRPSQWVGFQRQVPDLSARRPARSLVVSRLSNGSCRWLASRYRVERRMGSCCLE